MSLSYRRFVMPLECRWLISFNSWKRHSNFRQIAYENIWARSGPEELSALAARGTSQRTPLMIVAEKNKSAVKLPILKLLLSKGADKKLKDEDNRSARDYALRHAHSQVAQLLK